MLEEIEPRTQEGFETAKEVESADGDYLVKASSWLFANDSQVDRREELKKHNALASCRGVITVAGTTIKDKRAPFSNWGQAVDLSAPAMDVLSL